MNATTEAAQRIVSLDILRGIAVMGILAMNAIAFSMPEQAYFNPGIYGGAEGADLWAWALSFVFVDGKMRGLFSLLFGASMLLVIERANASGGNGGQVHVRRMVWLLLFGLAHFFFIWWGDILSLYAVIGLVAYAFIGKSPKALMRWAIGLFVAVTVIGGFLYASPFLMQAAATMPGADPEIVRQWQMIEADIGGTPAVLAADVALHQGSWLAIFQHKLADNWYFPLVQILMFGPETLAFMLLGMWGLKSGFMTGTWERRRYAKVTFICLAIAIPAYALLAYATYAADFAAAAGLAANMAGGTPFRPVMTIGYAALILYVIKGGAEGWFGRRVAAAGRAAFTNYLGTSIVMTTIFYGYGFGLYGEVGRAELWLFIVAMWALMLAWSKPWLDRYRYGPFEWLWRTLAKGQTQPMRKAAAAA